MESAQIVVIFIVGLETFIKRSSGTMKVTLSQARNKAYPLTILLLAWLPPP
jgi:hypothetical protein